MSTASTSLGADEPGSSCSTPVLVEMYGHHCRRRRIQLASRPKVGWTMALDKLATQQRDHLAW